LLLVLFSSCFLGFTAVLFVFIMGLFCFRFFFLWVYVSLRVSVSLWVYVSLRVSVSLRVFISLRVFVSLRVSVSLRVFVSLQVCFLVLLWIFFIIHDML